MPLQLSYPGVYIEELSGGRPSITGAPTSITAFVGVASTGPLNEPVQINSYSEYDRIFGGLSLSSPMSYAVQQYFQNGGGVAVIVRVVANDSKNATIWLGTNPDSNLILYSNEPEAATFRLRITKSASDYQLTLSTGSGPPLANVTLDSLDLDNIKTKLSGTPLSVYTPKSPPTLQALQLVQSASFTPVQFCYASANGLALASIEHTTQFKNYHLVVGPPADPTSESFGFEVVNPGNTQVICAGEASTNPDDTNYIGKVLADPERYKGGVPLFQLYNDTVPDKSPKTKENSLFQVVDEGKYAIVIPDPTGGFKLEAAVPGALGNSLTASTDLNTNPPHSLLFNLTLSQTLPSGETLRETYLNLSTQNSNEQFVGLVLQKESKLARLANPDSTLPATPAPSPGPTGTNQDGTDGTDYTGVLTRAPGGIYALKHVPVFNLLCLPPLQFGKEIETGTYTTALAFARDRRALLIVDPPGAWKNSQDAVQGINDITYLRSPNAAVFFPRIVADDPLRKGQPTEFVPCGAVAGVMARMDGTRGIWAAAAGVTATLQGVNRLSTPVTDADQGILNQSGINCLRSFPVIGNIIYGARTLEGADVLQSQWKYIPVRRMALFIEDSLYTGLQFAVFEPNAEPLWSQIRLSVGAFMQELFQQDAFAGRTPKEAYLVKCDQENNPQSSIDEGIVNVKVGFAPLKPAEFVIVQLQLLTGQ